ncbi:hypothetical protein U0070_012197 [Myodes glareolus]|uniref:Uncharacterized protein n=1 Tax=Myodes glareolus TaxID=447135 RepID=A0AAW0I3X2_MYOGA
MKQFSVSEIEARAAAEPLQTAQETFNVENRCDGAEGQEGEEGEEEGEEKEEKEKSLIVEGKREKKKRYPSIKENNNFPPHSAELRVQGFGLTEAAAT